MSDGMGPPREPSETDRIVAFARSLTALFVEAVDSFVGGNPVCLRCEGGPIRRRERGPDGPNPTMFGGPIMSEKFLERAARGEKIYLSEILSNLPSDAELAELFPGEGRRKPPFNHVNLEVFRLEIEGRTSREAAERLGLTRKQATEYAKKVRLCFAQDAMPDCLEIDVPMVRRLRGMELPRDSRYQKTSDLLRGMPSDRELRRLYADLGCLPGFGSKRCLSHADLVLLKKHASGQTMAAISREVGVTRERMRQYLVQIRRMIVRDLRLENDMPEIFPGNR